MRCPKHGDSPATARNPAPGVVCKCPPAVAPPLPLGASVADMPEVIEDARRGMAARRYPLGCTGCGESFLSDEEADAHREACRGTAYIL